MNVLVFKTDMRCDACKHTVGAVLGVLDLRWTVDLDDCDKILRVETDTVPARAVMQAVRQVGFVCEELI